MSNSGDSCGRCAASVNDPRCWCLHCGAALCNQCGDGFGHCGHPKADEMNRLPAEAHNAEARELLVAQLAAVMDSLSLAAAIPRPRTRPLLN